MRQNKFSGKNSKNMKSLNETQFKHLSDCVDWVYIQAVKELRNGGYEGDPKLMSGEIVSGIIQYLFGAVRAIKEDLQSDCNMEDWEDSNMSRVLEMLIGGNDIKRAESELSNLAEGKYAIVFMAGVRAVRHLMESISKGIEPSEWLKCYDGIFLNSLQLSLESV